MEWNNEILGLWPTPIVRDQSGDPELIGHLADPDVCRDLPGDDALFDADDAGIRSVRDMIAGAVEAYFEHLDVRPAPAWRLRGRLDRLAYGESRDFRNTPGAYLSGVFYIQTPKDTEALRLRKDTYPGFLTLFDPRPGFNMLSIRNDPYRDQAMMAEPQPGLFMMWPAFVNAYRHPNLSRTEQLCIAFDVVPAGGETADAAPATPWEGDIDDLWPTGLIKRRLPDYEQPTRALIELIDEMERENPELTTDFNVDRFQGSTHPAVQWLKAHIQESLKAYFKQMGMNYPISGEIRSWPNVNRFGDYHSPHNHPWSYLSGTYYLQVPEPEIGQDSPEPLKPGCISYYDPRAGMHAYDIPPGSRASRVHTVRPVPGALLMWPSPLYHFVHPNLSTRKRYSLSFNVHLQWQG